MILHIGRRGAYLAHRYTSRDVLQDPVDEDQDRGPQRLSG
jgi:hypothetical protein